MPTLIKSINKHNTKFSINGKLAVLRYGPNKEILNLSYSKGLTDKEDRDFKNHLESINII